MLVYECCKIFLWMPVRPLCPLLGSSGTGGQGGGRVGHVLLSYKDTNVTGICIIKIPTDAYLFRGIPICTCA